MGAFLIGRRQDLGHGLKDNKTIAMIGYRE